MQASQLFVHHPFKLKQMARKAKKKKKQKKKKTKKERKKKKVLGGPFLESRKFLEQSSLSGLQHREGGGEGGWQCREINPKPMNGYKTTWKAFLLVPHCASHQSDRAIVVHFR